VKRVLGTLNQISKFMYLEIKKNNNYFLSFLEINGFATLLEIIGCFVRVPGNKIKWVSENLNICLGIRKSNVLYWYPETKMLKKYSEIAMYPEMTML